MRILLFGKNGQLGRTLLPHLKPFGEIEALGRDDVQLEEIDELNRVLGFFSPDVIVNAAAYTAVDNAEIEPYLAYQINAEAVAAMAKWACKNNRFLIHYSSDYVFDGSKDEPYTESDLASPINAYGLSKYFGDKSIIESQCNAVILRVSWLYSCYGQNFVKRILNLAANQECIHVVDDQWGSPTSTYLTSEVTVSILRTFLQKKPCHGLYHLTPAGKTTWYGFALSILELAHERGVPLRVTLDRLYPISSADFKARALRPKNSCLNTCKISQDLKLHLLDWREYLAQVFDGLISNINENQLVVEDNTELEKIKG